MDPATWTAIGTAAASLATETLPGLLPVTTSVLPEVSGMAIDPLLAAGGTSTITGVGFNPAFALPAAKQATDVWSGITGGRQPQQPRQPAPGFQRKSPVPPDPISQFTLTSLLSSLPPEMRQEYGRMFGGV